MDNQTNSANLPPVPPAQPANTPKKKPIFKKWWFWVIIVVVLIGIISAAGGGKNKDIADITPATNDGTNAISNADDNGKTDVPADSNTTLDEQVLWENDVCKITALSYETDSIWGDRIKILGENKGTQTLHIGCDALIVNDYMITDLFSAEIAPGKKSNESIDLMSSELSAAGIENVGKIDLYLYYYEGDSYTNKVKSDCITIKTSHYDDMDTTPNDTGTELYNADGVRIVGKYVNENSFWGAAILLYIENNSGKNIVVTTDELSVNGFMITDYFYATIYEGKRIIDDVTLSSTDLKENGIEKIEEIELKFTIREEDDYLHSTTTDAITFSVN